MWQKIIRKEAAESLFNVSFIFYININRNAVLRGNECNIFANSLWAVLPPLLLADGVYLVISLLLSYSL
jgi:hypothetical protein